MSKIKTLKDFPLVQMNNAESEHMITVMMGDPVKVNVTMGPNDLDEAGFLGKVFNSRMNAHGVKVTIGLGVFILTLLRSPGDSTLWVWTLFNMQKDDSHVLTMDDFVQTFPMGIPSRDSYEKAWDSQKGSAGGNLLDQQATWVRANLAQVETAN